MTTKPKRYKLLKDLPTLKAGRIFQKDPQDSDRYLIDGGPEQVHRLGNIEIFEWLVNADQHPDWFQPLDEQTGERWRADREGGELPEYYYITSSIEADLTIDNDMGTDPIRYKVGNYFRTREQAEAASEAIRAVLAYIQDPTLERDYDKFIEPIDKAWRTLQNTDTEYTE